MIRKNAKYAQRFEELHAGVAAADEYEIDITEKAATKRSVERQPTVCDFPTGALEEGFLLVHRMVGTLPRNLAPWATSPFGPRELARPRNQLSWAVLTSAWA